MTGLTNLAVKHHEVREARLISEFKSIDGLDKLTLEVEESSLDGFADQRQKVNFLRQQAFRFFTAKKAVKKVFNSLEEEVKKQGGLRQCDNNLSKEFFLKKKELEQATKAFDTVLESYKLVLNEGSASV